MPPKKAKAWYAAKPKGMTCPDGNVWRKVWACGKPVAGKASNRPQVPASMYDVGRVVKLKKNKRTYYWEVVALKTYKRTNNPRYKGKLPPTNTPVALKTRSRRPLSPGRAKQVRQAEKRLKAKRSAAAAAAAAPATSGDTRRIVTRAQYEAALERMKDASFNQRKNDLVSRISKMNSLQLMQFDRKKAEIEMRAAAQSDFLRKQALYDQKTTIQG